VRPKLGTVVRWLLAALILGYSAWKLGGAWTALEPTALVWRPIPLLAGSLVGGAALVTLAVVAGVGLRAAQLPVGGARPGFWLGWMRVWFQGYFYRYVPGKLMLVVERARLGERLGIPKAASVMLVVWESLLLLAGAGLFGGVGLLALPGGDGPLSGALVAALALASLVGSLLLWPIVGALARRAPRLAARLPGSVLTVSSAAQVGLVAANAVAWALLGASFALVCVGMAPDEAPPMGLLVVWFVASYVGGQLAGVVPAGIGVREGLLVAGLASVAPAPLVLAWAVVHRILLAVVELLLFGATFLAPFPEEAPVAPAAAAGE